jgi:DNA invertase Pin-like site-specific DNA recombinase
MVQRRNKALVMLGPSVDTSTPSGRLVASIFSALNEWEADVISQRTTDALAAKRAEGRAICRPSVIDDAKLTGQIKALADAGHSLHEIARLLTAGGVPTLRRGSQWRASSVQSALGYKRPRTHEAANLPTIRRQRQSGRKAG